MVMDFEQMVQRILEVSQLGRDELMTKIKNKQDELSGFVTLEGAANIIARELGIILEHKEAELRALRIEDLIPGMSKVDILARVVRIREPKEFQRPNGKPGQVASLTIRDETGETRLVLWDEKSTLITEGRLKKGDIVLIQNAYVRNGIDKKPELSLGARGSIAVNPEHPRVKELPQVDEGRAKISELKLEMGEVDVVGIVVTAGEVRSFERADGRTGKVSTLILMDQTGQVRVSLWDEWAESTKGLKRGEAVALENATVRPGLGGKVELSLGSSGRLVKGMPDVYELPKLKEGLLKVGEVEAEMRPIDLTAAVKRKFPMREFKRGDGSTGKVASVILADDTGTLRASFWDAQAPLVDKMQVGDVLSLRNTYARSGLGGRPEIQVDKTAMVEINPPGVEVAGLEPRHLKIGELEPNLSSVEVAGRVVEVTGPREFTRPDGSKGKVASLIIGDQSSTARVSLWGEHADEAGRINVGDVVKLSDAYTTLGLFGQPELHLGRQGNLEISPGEELPSVAAIDATARPGLRLEISEIESEGVNAQVRGTVLKVFHRRPIFDVCPECGRSLGAVDANVVCEECGKTVTPEHRLVLSLLLDDGTGNMRVVFFGEAAERLLSMSSQQILEALRSKPDLAIFYNDLKLVGRELLVLGRTRRDKYFDQIELRASEVEIPDPVQEANDLLKKLKETA